MLEADRSPRRRAGALAAAGYDCSLALGYPYDPGAGPAATQLPFGDKGPLYRFRYTTPGGGAHLFTRGADNLAGMTCEPPARGEVLTDHACFAGVPGGCRGRRPGTGGSALFPVAQPRSPARDPVVEVRGAIPSASWGPTLPSERRIGHPARLHLEDEMATTKTLPELAAVYGPPDPAMRGALLSATSTDTFGDDGAQMGTERVLTDVNRMLPTAIDAWERADTAQRRLLLGVGPGVFAVHLAEALALEALWARRIGEEAGDAGTRTEGTQGLGEVHAEAVTARGVAVSGLRVVAGANRALQREIAEATGTADSEEALAQGLERLAALGGAWAAGPTLGALCAQGGLDAAWVADTLALAARLRSADREEGRRRMEGVSQAELDHQDGVVLHLLRSLVRVFDAANRADRRLPRLTPQATRRFFGRDETAEPTEPEMSDEPT